MIKNIKKPLFLAFILSISAQFPSYGIMLKKDAVSYYSKSNRLIVVLTPNWESPHATIMVFEKGKANKWIPYKNIWAPETGNKEKAEKSKLLMRLTKPFKAVVGKHGLAWGTGIHNVLSSYDQKKKEGDNKGVAGIFKVGNLFMKESQIKEFGNHSFNKIVINRHTVAVDDTKSKYYNQIIDRSKVKKDWDSAEQMSKIELYELGFVINHNMDKNHKPTEIGGGSNIFFHIWRNENMGTAGCVAVNHANLKALVTWLNEGTNPMIVILPMHEYRFVPKSVLHNLPAPFELLE